MTPATLLLARSPASADACACCNLLLCHQSDRMPRVCMLHLARVSILHAKIVTAHADGALWISKGHGIAVQCG